MNILGDARANILVGSDSDDVIWGKSGQDTLIGGSGNDYLDGGADDDFVDGGAGDDVFAGDAPNWDGNVFEGVAGKDVVTGGLGIDTVNMFFEQSSYKISQTPTEMVFSNIKNLSITTIDITEANGVEFVRFNGITITGLSLPLNHESLNGYDYAERLSCSASQFFSNCIGLT